MSNGLADFVRNRRNELGLTFREVMYRSRKGGSKGISDGYVGKIENGELDNPSPSKIQALAVGLDVSEAELLDAIGIGKPDSITDPRVARLEFSYPKLNKERKIRIDALLDAVDKELRESSDD